MKVVAPESSSKWLAMAASIWIQCSCGASYAFGIYSPALKSTQSYDQSTLDTVSVFKDIGANAGVLSGLLYAAVVIPSSYSSTLSSVWVPRGPWVVLMAGAVQCFVGYFFMWLSVAGVIPRPPVALMCLFMFLAAHSQTFFSTANVVTAVHNFPQYNGTVVGILKGFLGLSGAVLVQVYYALFKDNPSNFLLMLAVLPSLLTILLMCFVKIRHTHSRDERRHLNSFSWVSVMIAAYLMFLIILDNIVTLPQFGRIFALVFLLVLLSSPLGVAVKAQEEDSPSLPQTTSSASAPLLDDTVAANAENSLATENPTSSRVVASNAVTSTASSKNLLAIEDDMTAIQAICSMNFWLLFIAMMLGMGSGLATINNISQMGESLGYTFVETSTLVSLWSIWNFLGRFLAGYLSDIFLHKGWPRPLFICLTLATMSVGHLVIASGFPGNLYVGSVLVGITYGSQWSLMPTITCDIFGAINMGTLFNTIAVASPVGSYIFSVRVIGQIYDEEASAEGNTCYGTHCFMFSFFILASVSFCGSLVALFLFFRTRSFYTRVVLRRLRHASKS